MTTKQDEKKGTRNKIPKEDKMMFPRLVLHINNDQRNEMRLYDLKRKTCGKGGSNPPINDSNSFTHGKKFRKAKTLWIL